MKSPFIHEYKKDMIRTMQQINPEWPEEYIEDIIDRKLNKKMQVVPVLLDNNVKGDTIGSTLNAVFDWVLTRKPIIAGNGTFYETQDKAYNPTSVMLQNMKSERAAAKKLLFSTPDDQPALKLQYELRQSNKKVDMNSWYGGSGAETAAFYSKWSGPATTLSAQSVISTTEQMFESFIADNYLYLDITELMHWMKVVLEDVSDDDEQDPFIKDHTVKEVCDRLLIKILDPKETDEEILTKALSNMSQCKLNILYYKNNLIKFIDDHKVVQSIFKDILCSVKNGEYTGDKSHDSEVSKEYFMDPNDPPDTIIDDLKMLTALVMRYVYADYLSMDRIYRLRNFKRRCVTVIDTDSNILSLDPVMEFIFDNIVKGETYGRSKNQNIFILVNTLTYLITEAVKRILKLYAKSSNIDPDYWSYYSMKNEFFFTNLLIGNAKKRYISKVLLREGNLLDPPKLDVKGFDFKKATCSDYAEEKFMNIIKNNIINTDEINIRGMMKELKEFRDSIKESIMSGETYLLQNTSVKDISAYDKPESQLNLRAVLTWNMIYPDDKIDFPAKVSLLKLKTFKPEDILPLEKTHPEIFNIIMKNIFNDTTGIFISKKKKTNPKTKEVDYVPDVKGMQAIAIPANRKIPEWVFPYVDWSTTINNIIAPFMPVLAIFGNKGVEEGKTYGTVNRKSNRFSNIIKF